MDLSPDDLENAALPPSTFLSLLCADPVQGVRSRAIELTRRKPLDYWLSENISLSQNWVLDNQNVQTGDILLRNDMHSAYQAIQAAELGRKICAHAVHHTKRHQPNASISAMMVFGLNDGSCKSHLFSNNTALQ